MSFAKQMVRLKSGEQQQIVRFTSTEQQQIVRFILSEQNKLYVLYQVSTECGKKKNWELIPGSLWFVRKLDVFFNVETDLGEPAFEVSTVLLDDYLNSFKVMICTR